MSSQTPRAPCPPSVANANVSAPPHANGNGVTAGKRGSWPNVLGLVRWIRIGSLVLARRHPPVHRMGWPGETRIAAAAPPFWPMKHRWMESIIPTDKRFWLKVYQRGDCWEWRGHRRQNGYGQFCMLPREYARAHRYAYEAAFGNIPSHLELDHLCNHKWCVRPSHLLASTHRENSGRVDRKPWSIVTCKHGHVFTPENTYVYHDKRHCRICLRRNRAAFRQREKENV